MSKVRFKCVFKKKKENGENSDDGHIRYTTRDHKIYKNKNL